MGQAQLEERLGRSTLLGRDEAQGEAGRELARPRGRRGPTQAGAAVNGALKAFFHLPTWASGDGAGAEEL